MSVSEMFSEFLSKLAIKNSEDISYRYGEITCALNKYFRDSESKEANSLRVGSIGRNTAIDGVSDLDMLYIMPKTQWTDYDKQGGQSKLLQDTKAAILKRYPNTDVRVDRLVVMVMYTDGSHIEVQPVFEQDDGSFKYPDTKNGSSWKITKPKEEMQAVADLDKSKNSNLRRLCKMARAWKNKHGVGMGGLLIDTLAYNFLKSTTDYDDKSYLYYDWLSRDFFKYLADEPDKDRYAAPGSGQHVKVKKKFQRKAKKAYELCLDAIKAENQNNVNDKWRKVYGRPFPSAKAESSRALGAALAQTWRNTEEFIEDKFPVDIRGSMTIDCEVKQNGFRKFFLLDMLNRRVELRSQKSLLFWVKDLSVQKPYQLFWKVLNRGDEAKRRDSIRGQILPDEGYEQRQEHTQFRGEHVVECYCVKDGVVVAKDRIHVPIVTNGADYV